MKHTILLMLLVITPCLTLAQKTKVRTIRQELSQARTYIKSGKDKDLSSAEKLMTDLLAKDSANRQNPRICCFARIKRRNQGPSYEVSGVQILSKT